MHSIERKIVGGAIALLLAGGACEVGKLIGSGEPLTIVNIVDGTCNDLRKIWSAIQDQCE